MQELKKYPPSLNAAKHIAENYTYGDIITDDVVLPLLEIEPESNQPIMPEEYKQRQFALLAQSEKMKVELLEQHNMMLVRSRTAGGWLIVSPSDQTEYAMKDLQSSLRKVTAKASKRLLCIDRTRLSHEESQRNTEAIAKLKQVSASNKKAIGFSFDSADAVN